jgi:hypothetical protein
MSNSKRYSGEKVRPGPSQRVWIAGDERIDTALRRDVPLHLQDAFDKRAEELRAMLAESRRWLVEVELGDAEAEAGRYRTHASARRRLARACSRVHVRAWEHSHTTGARTGSAAPTSVLTTAAPLNRHPLAHMVAWQGVVTAAISRGRGAVQPRSLVAATGDGT